MTEPNRDTLLRSIEDFEATLAKLQSNNVVLATPVLLRRLEELGLSASALGDPILSGMIVRLRRHLTTGNCVCSAMSASRLNPFPSRGMVRLCRPRRSIWASMERDTFAMRRKDDPVQIQRKHYFNLGDVRR